MDETQFNAIVTNHSKLIFKVCSAYCKNPSHRNDLTQEILLQLWRSFKKFDGSVKISTWEYRIAINTAISFYRGELKYKGTGQITGDIIALSSDMSDSRHPDFLTLMEFIHELNEFDKGLMLLYLDGHPHKDIAQILGITASNAGTRIARIKAKLRNRFFNVANDNHERK